MLALLAARRSHLSSKTLHLFRAFFPSWRFFEDSGQFPVLFYRKRIGEHPFGPWDRCIERPSRTLISFFLNPRGNSLLAFGSLLQHLESDLQEVDETRPQEIEGFVSYRLTQNLVLRRLAEDGFLREGIRYQFKLCALTPGLSDDQAEEMLVSGVHEARRQE